MTWQELLAARRVESHVTSAQELAMGPSVGDTASYLDRCRRKRNEISYDTAGLVSDTEAKEIVTEMKSFQSVVEGWIRKNHPQLSSRER